MPPFFEGQSLHCYEEADRTRKARGFDAIIGKGVVSFEGQDSSNRAGILSSAMICEQRLIELSV